MVFAACSRSVSDILRRARTISCFCSCCFCRRRCSSLANVGAATAACATAWWVWQESSPPSRLATRSCHCAVLGRTRCLQWHRRRPAHGMVGRTRRDVADDRVHAVGRSFGWNGVARSASENRLILLSVEGENVGRSIAQLSTHDLGKLLRRSPPRERRDPCAYAQGYTRPVGLSQTGARSRSNADTKNSR